MNFKLSNIRFNFYLKISWIITSIRHQKETEKNVFKMNIFLSNFSWFKEFSFFNPSWIWDFIYFVELSSFNDLQKKLYLELNHKNEKINILNVIYPKMKVNNEYIFQIYPESNVNVIEWFSNLLWIVWNQFSSKWIYSLHDWRRN